MFKSNSPTVRHGYCQADCEEPDLKADLTPVRVNGETLWCCDGCREEFLDEAIFQKVNAVDMADCGETFRDFDFYPEFPEFEAVPF